LTGRENPQYPPFGNREVPGYTLEKDLHLYLYFNLVLYPWSDSALEERIRLIYESWDPATLHWSNWADALSTVKVVYVENEYLGHAMERLQKLFTIKKIVSCKNGRALSVNLKAASNDSQGF
jgi:hypothetical protein